MNGFAVLKTAVCGEFSELVDIVGIEEAVAYFPCVSEFRESYTVNGNECHIYQNDDGYTCVDEIIIDWVKK